MNSLKILISDLTQFVYQPNFHSIFIELMYSITVCIFFIYFCLSSNKKIKLKYCNYDISNWSLANLEISTWNERMEKESEIVSLSLSLSFWRKLILSSFSFFFWNGNILKIDLLYCRILLYFIFTFPRVLGTLATIFSLLLTSLVLFFIILTSKYNIHLNWLDSQSFEKKKKKKTIQRLFVYIYGVLHLFDQRNIMDKFLYFL